MKQIFKYIVFSFVAMAALSACEERYVTYDGQEYVMFADTLNIYPIQAESEMFSIPVVSTGIRD